MPYAANEMIAMMPPTIAARMIDSFFAAVTLIGSGWQK
jgi:hypothetical protein